VKSVKTSLHKAETKIASEIKNAALHKNNLVMKQRVEEARRSAELIKRQLVDAESQRVKISNERKIAGEKAKELSIASAKARARVEWAYRSMVMENNKICGQCKIGRQRIVSRRKEIDNEMQQEVLAKASRSASHAMSMKAKVKKHNKKAKKPISTKVKITKKPAAKKFFTKRVKTASVKGGTKTGLKSEKKRSETFNVKQKAE
jgi:hypothetical protein